MIGNSFAIHPAAVFLRWNGVCYLLAAGMALTFDLCLYLFALDVGLVPSVAAATSYASGMLLHAGLAVRCVFCDTTASISMLRRRQTSLFVVAALLGLVVTVLCVSALTSAGMAPLMAKAVAVLATFSVGFSLRRRMLLLA